MVLSSARQAFAKRTNKLHWSVLALYFALAFLEAFPMTAFGAWVQFDLKMSVADQSNFYASIFIPWTLKPLYGWLSERVPIAGYRRKPYLIICVFASATSWLLLSYLVTTISGAYIVTLLRTTANAFAELLLGLTLVDCAGRDMRNAGSLQAAATGSRAAASVLALLVGLPLYSCHGDGTPPNPRHMMLINGGIGLVAALLTLFLPDTKVGANHRTLWRRPAQPHNTDMADDTLRQPLLVNPEQVTAPLPSVPSRFPVLELFVPSLLLFLVWSACQDLMSHQHWLIFLYVVIGINLLVATGVYRTRKHSRNSLQDLTVIWPALVLFFIAAMPSASDTLFSYRYSVWPDHQCYIQTLSIVTSVTALAFSWVYFFFLHHVHGRSLIRVYIAANVVSGAAVLLWWPWVRGDIRQEGLPSLGYAIFVSIVTGGVGQIALVSGLVLATQACPMNDQTGFAYALYISFMDVGSSVSGWVTAPIVKALPITLTNFSKLPTLLVIDSATTIVATMAAPLLYFARFSLPAQAETVVETEEGLQQLDESHSQNSDH
eukprot:m.80602 g.80602  ORF g.80602 m.80602 type:complete len:546 (+) comp14553_c0_seq1:131-1768(+)